MTPVSKYFKDLQNQRRERRYLEKELLRNRKKIQGVSWNLCRENCILQWNSNPDSLSGKLFNLINSGIS